VRNRRSKRIANCSIRCCNIAIFARQERRGEVKPDPAVRRWVEVGPDRHVAQAALQEVLGLVRQRDSEACATVAEYVDGSDRMAATSR
jgi:hypothetical protein